MTSQSKLRIYYDGLCPICSKEIEVYRKQNKSHRAEFIDIAAPGFDASKEGLNPDDVLEKFHVKTVDGTILQGVPAFIEIWKTLEIWKPLQVAAESKLLRPLFDVGYKGFTVVRPFFRNIECNDDYCNTNSSFKEIS